MLRTMLLVHPENHDILVCLVEVVVVLSTNQTWTHLEQFLRGSNQVIEMSSPLAIPFRYALAACTDDKRAKLDYGSQLQTANDHVIPRFGKNHPHVLVDSYYLAWHLMDKKDYVKVINISECLVRNVPEDTRWQTS